MKKAILFCLAILIGLVLILAFDKKPTSQCQVVQLESSADVTLWLNENNPSEVIDIETTGFLWWVFYKK